MRSAMRFGCEPAIPRRAIASRRWARRYRDFAHPTSFSEVLAKAQVKLAEQGPRCGQVRRVETLGKPGVNRHKRVTCGAVPVLVDPQFSQAHRGPQFPEFCTLLRGLFQARLQQQGCVISILRAETRLQAEDLGRAPLFAREFDQLCGAVEQSDCAFEISVVALDLSDG